MLQYDVDSLTEMTGAEIVGGASGHKTPYSLKAIGKKNNSDFPYTVANELVGTAIGRILGLHVPEVLPFVVDGTAVALVLKVSKSGASGSIVQHWCQSNPEQLHNAIVFDLFIANNDRAFGEVRRNLDIVDGRLFLYDQGNGCFYRNRPSQGIKSGIDRLDKIEQNFLAMFDMNHKKNNYFQLLSSLPLAKAVCEKISLIPDFVIENIVESVPLISNEEKSRLKLFLNKRKTVLYSLIETHFETLKGFA